MRGELVTGADGDDRRYRTTSRNATWVIETPGWTNGHIEVEAELLAGPACGSNEKKSTDDVTSHSVRADGPGNTAATLRSAISISSPHDVQCTRAKPLQVCLQPAGIAPHGAPN